jgi:mxaD protein
MKSVTMSVAILLVAFAFAASPAAAHGPTPQKVVEIIAIAAPPEKVWEAVKNFDALAAWNPLVASSAGKGGNDAGAERTVVLKAGGQLVDGLDEYLGDQMSYSYRLSTPDIEKFPVSFYSATLLVRPGESGGSEVEWDSRLYRADTGNFPAETQNDQAAIDAMSNFLKAGLENLKQTLEAH